MSKTVLSVSNILAARDSHIARQGKKPTQLSGDATNDGLEGWTWGNVNTALRKPIPGGEHPDFADEKGSLPRLFALYGAEAAVPVLAPPPIAVEAPSPSCEAMAWTDTPGPNTVKMQALMMRDCPDPEPFMTKIDWNTRRDLHPVQRWPTKSLLKG